MGENDSHQCDVALEAVRRAARVCQSVQATITDEFLEKKDRSPVTVADYCSQAVVCRALQSAFPDDPVIGEEDSTELRAGENVGFLDRIVAELADIGIDATGDGICDWIDRGGAGDYSDRFWTLDPIDGTKGFLRGEQYAISLALIENGNIQLAVLGCPNLPVDPARPGQTGALLYAIRDGGSWVAPLHGEGVPIQIGVSHTDQTSDARLCESVESGHSAHGKSAEVAADLGIRRDPVRLDSQAKYAVVARGEADVYLRLPTRADYREKIWDHAGGVLVVEEAGGRVTDVAGKDLDFTHGRELAQNRGVVVSNALLHDRIISALVAAGVS